VQIFYSSFEVFLNYTTENIDEGVNKLFEIDTIKTIVYVIYIFSIHPRTKHDVGYRLSRSGLAVAYGQQVEFQGPIVQNVAYTTGGSTVEITYTGVSSIELRNPNGFEVSTVLS
jgi:hypothetical protein